MKINDSPYGEKFLYLGRKVMCVPFSRFGYGEPINAIDIKTGKILYVPEEEELHSIEICFAYAVENFTKNFGELSVGDKFFFGNDLFIRSEAFLNSDDVLVDAYCLTSGKMACFWDDEEIFPVFEK